MLALEARLPAIVEDIGRDFQLLETYVMTRNEMPPVSMVCEVLAKYEAMNLPLTHSSTLKLHMKFMGIVLCCLPTSHETEHIQLKPVDNFIAYIRANQHFPSQDCADSYVDAGKHFANFDSAALLSRARECCETGLKTDLIIAGPATKRGERAREVTKTLVSVLQRLSELGVHTVAEKNKCALCTESPDRAAIKLNVCGRCKETQYCSRECQTAHWKIHKQACGK